MKFHEGCGGDWVKEGDHYTCYDCKAEMVVVDCPGSISSTCENCGATVRIGDWPYCAGDPSKHVPAHHFGEEPLTPYMDEHLGPEPVEIRTRAQRRAIMAQNHLDYHDVSKKKRGRVYVDLGR